MNQPIGYVYIIKNNQTNQLTLKGSVNPEKNKYLYKLYQDISFSKSTHSIITIKLPKFFVPIMERFLFYELRPHLTDKTWKHKPKYYYSAPTPPAIWFRRMDKKNLPKHYATFIKNKLSN